MAAKKNVKIEYLPNCGRCGEDHEDLDLEPLENPIKVVDAFELTHWCPCPTNGQPIVMKIEEAPKRRRPARGNAVVAETT